MRSDKNQALLADLSDMWRLLAAKVGHLADPQLRPWEWEDLWSAYPQQWIPLVALYEQRLLEAEGIASFSEAHPTPAAPLALLRFLAAAPEEPADEEFPHVCGTCGRGRCKWWAVRVWQCRTRGAPLLLPFFVVNAATCKLIDAYATRSVGRYPACH